MENNNSGSNFNMRMGKGWWIGVAGNILSTVMGIVLTLGIASLVDQYKDKKTAREMMFNVVKTAEDNIPTVEKMDSLTNIETDAVMKLFLYYAKDNGDLSKVPSDTLDKYLARAVVDSKTKFWSCSTNSYFYSAQMMHQFKNPEIYNYFAAYVEFDEAVNANISRMNAAAKQLSTEIRSRRLLTIFDYDAAEVTKQLIEDHTLTDYFNVIESVNFSRDVESYKAFRDNMLLQMGATREDFDKYCEKNSLVNEKQVTNI